MGQIASRFRLKAFIFARVTGNPLKTAGEGGYDREVQKEFYMRKRSFAPFILAFFALTLGSCISSPGGGVTPASDSYFDLDFEAFLSENNIRFLSKSFVYDGEYHSLEIEGNLPEGYKVWYEGDEQKDVGEYEVFACFGGPGIHYENQYVLHAYMTISPAMVDESQIVFEDATYVYDGDLHMIEIAKPYPDGIVSVDYGTNGYVDAGDYEITAHFQVDDNHAPVADKTARLTILPYEVDMSEVVFEDKTVTYDGYTHAIYAEHLPWGVDVNYEGNHQWEAGIYQVTANFTAPRNAAPIDPMHAVLTIEQAPFDLSSVSFPDQEARYDGKTHPIEIQGELPAGILVEYENNENVEVGSYEVTAHFLWNESYSDIESIKQNYYLPGDMKATLNILKGIPGVSLNDQSVPFDEESHSLFIEGDLPEGITVEYFNNEHSEIGEYQVTAHFSGSNEHYECPEDMTATLYISGESPYLEYKDFGDYYGVVNYEGKTETALNIPAFYEGKPVKSVLLDDEFSRYSSVRKIFVYGDLDSFSAKYVFPNLESIHFYGDVLRLEQFAGGNLKEVIFDGKVVELGYSAFYFEDDLERIALPEGLETIGPSAFHGCYSLKEITLPATLKTIGYNAFHSCAFEEMSLPKGLTSIGESVFCYNTKLTAFSLPSDITAIPNSLFEGCSSLKRINSPDDGVFDLGENVVSLGGRCFYDCPGVQELLVPSLKGEIDGAMFSRMPNLRRLVVGDEISKIVKSFDASLGALESINSDIPGKVVLPAMLKEITDSFIDCPNIKTLQVNDGLETISNSFQQVGITELVLPDTVTTLADSFRCSLVRFYATGIEEANASTGLRDYWYSSLREAVMPVWMFNKFVPFGGKALEDLTIVGEGTIDGSLLMDRCPNLKSLSIEADFVEDVSLKLPSLTSLHLGKNVSRRVYTNQMPMLTTLTVDTENPNYSTDGVLLYNKDRTAILGAASQASFGLLYSDYTVPSTITSIEKYGLTGAAWLHSFTADHPISLGIEALAECPKLKTVSLPVDYTRNNWSYNNEHLLLGSPVTHLTTPCVFDAADVYETLEELEITGNKGSSSGLPESFPQLSSIRLHTNSNLSVLGKAGKLSKLRLVDIEEPEEGKPYDLFFDAQGGLYKYSKTYSDSQGTYHGYRLLAVSPDLCPETFVLPRQTNLCAQQINTNAFRNCDALRQLTAEGGGTLGLSFYEDAFANSRLEGVILTDIYYLQVDSEAFHKVNSLRSFSATTRGSGFNIMENGFHELPSLKMVTLRNLSAETSRIYTNAFNGCPELGTVNLERSYLYPHSFHDCPAISTVDLRRIRLHSDTEDIFDEGSSIKTVSGLSYYSSLSAPSPLASQLSNVESVRVEYLEKYYLAGFTSVKTVITEVDQNGRSLGNTISAYACAGCVSLEEVQLHEGLLLIYGHAFEGCVRLTSFTLPASVRSIGESAFAGCTQLETLYYDGTMEQWEAITLEENWNEGTKLTKVICSDGVVAL